ncbi:MAG: rhodanese-like domain-containing protein [Deltaproteobacteria bacterium]|nr:rhodanese-like domain-containing protein [Deltaproteobacteria bacterium]
MSYQNIQPKEAFQKTKEGYAYLDVRTTEEFDAGHAKGAVNISIFISTPAGREFNPNFLALVAEKFPKPAKLVIGCHSGGRSGKACELLNAQGYNDVFNIDGGFGGKPGIPGWEEEGLPVE